MEEFKKVIIKGVDIPFMDLVVLLVKLSLAAIPAMFIVFGTFAIFNILFLGV
jgi:hypothetical protein